MTRYQSVVNYLLNEIQQNRWAEGEPIVSENQLVDLCKVSRMTARRALKQLESDGLVYSIRGKGTFITPAKSHSSAIELRNIAEEIRSRGHHYECQVLEHGSSTDAAMCKQFGTTTLFTSQVIHFENGQAIQYEHRFVNPAIAPDYLAINLNETTAYEYLIQCCPVYRMENQIEAVAASDDLKKLLQLEPNEPLLKVRRITFQGQAVVSIVTLFHPGSRFSLGAQQSNEPN